MPRSNLTGAVDWERFGARLREAIAETKMSYRDLADDLDGVGYATLHRIAHGKKPVTAATYLWLCNEFSIDPMWAYIPPNPLS